MKFKARLVQILFAWLGFLVLPGYSAPVAFPPVKCVETETNFTLDNGILRAVILKHNGTMASLVFQGRELLSQNGGYWSSVGRNRGGKSGFETSIRQDTTNCVEVSCRIGNFDGATNCPLDSDFRYTLKRGEPVIYVAAIFHHSPGTYGYGTGESRYCMKLNPQVFNFLSIDAKRQRLMPTGYDWDHGTTLNLKEARRLNTGIHRGEVEHKYDYSAILAETPAYGWFGTKSRIGLWLINPSQEYIGGGPTKVELTGHLDVNPGGKPTLLNMWQGSHYGGTSLAVAPDETWTKVVGPFAIYCNRSLTAFDAWKNALARAGAEEKQWPYEWFDDTNYPNVAGRGTVAGQIILRDSYAPDARMSNLWVGVAAPDYIPPSPRFSDSFHRNLATRFSQSLATNGPNFHGFPPFVDWQRDAKFYQFWTRAGADGRFEIHHVRPGAYTLHAFADGVLGEIALTNVLVHADNTNSLGELIWRPERFGRTLWEIGVPDRSAHEFLHGDDYWRWGLYNQYAMDFPNDVNYVVGQSDWHRDWNYVQPPHFSPEQHPIVSENPEPDNLDNEDSEPSYRSPGLDGSTWSIQFSLTNVSFTHATLRLSFAGARDGCHVAVSLNGKAIGDTGPLPSTGVMHRDGIRGYWFERDLPFDARLLKMGTNSFKLTSFANNWTQGVLYDCVRLEVE